MEQHFTTLHWAQLAMQLVYPMLRFNIVCTQPCVYSTVHYMQDIDNAMCDECLITVFTCFPTADIVPGAFRQYYWDSHRIRVFNVAQR